MLKLHALTLVTLLLLTVIVGCSSSDQGAIDKTVSPTLTAAQPANAAPTATSTPEPLPTVTPAATATSAPTPLPVFPLEIDPVLEPVRFLESLPASEVSCAADALDSKDRFVEIIQYVFGSQEGIDVPTEAESSVMDKCISEETVAAIFSGKLYLEIGGISDKTHVCIREKVGGYPFTRIFLENSPDSDVFFSFLQGLFCLNGQERSELSQSDLSFNEIGGMDAIECFVNELGHKGAAVFIDPEFASLLDPHSDSLFVMIECGLLDEAEFEKEFGVSLEQFLCVIGEIDTEAGLEFLSDPLALSADLSPIELQSILSSCGLTLEDIAGDASLTTEPPSTSFPTPPTVVPAPTVPPMVKPDTEIVDGEATKITKAPEVPLLIAIQNEDLETVLAHISHGTDLNDTYGDALGTLHTAVLRYNLEVVDALIRAGVNIEMRTKDQLEFTPLLLATWFGKLKMVELLVESGADLEATDGFGANALQVSMEDNPNIPESQLESFNERRKQTYLFLEALEAVEAPEVPLLIAIQNEDLETVLAHISYGTDPNSIVDDYGLGPLHWAVIGNNLEVVDALIRADADIEMPTLDQLRFTPLIMAAWLGKLQMVELLVESGAHLYATNVLGANALQVSMEDNPNIPEDELESFNERRKQIILFLENAGG
jgi:ankyrin repeat protein